MANQVEFEAFIHHHNQNLMREAEVSRSLKRMKRTSANKDHGAISVFSWLKRQLISGEPAGQDQFTENVQSEQNLFTG